MALILILAGSNSTEKSSFINQIHQELSLQLLYASIDHKNNLYRNHAVTKQSKGNLVWPRLWTSVVVVLTLGMVYFSANFRALQKELWTQNHRSLQGLPNVLRDQVEGLKSDAIGIKNAVEKEYSAGQDQPPTVAHKHGEENSFKKLG